MCQENFLGGPLLEPAEAYREAEEFLAQFDVLYPNETILRNALRGAVTQGIPTRRDGFLPADADWESAKGFSAATL